MAGATFDFYVFVDFAEYADPLALPPASTREA